MKPNRPFKQILFASYPKRRQLSQILSILLVLSWLLTGCQAAPKTTTPLATPQAAPSITPSPTAIPPNPTDPPTPSPTLTSLPSPSPTLEACEETSGKLERLQVRVEFFSKPVFFQLYLPSCYSPTAAGRYPVLFLLHGQNFTDEQWIRLGIVDTANRLIAAKEIPPFILVLPYEEYGLQDPAESSFGQIVTEGLLPWVNEHYNTCTDRECRAIGGVSRGAGWAVRLGFTDWQQFGAVGAHSLAYFWGDNVMLRQWTRQIPAGQMPRIYMDIGDADRYLPFASEFEALLTQYQVPHTWLVNQGKHDEDYWQAHIEEYLRWYTLPWKK